MQLLETPVFLYAFNVSRHRSPSVAVPDGFDASSLLFRIQGKPDVILSAKEYGHVWVPSEGKENLAVTCEVRDSIQCTLGRAYLVPPRGRESTGVEITAAILGPNDHRPIGTVTYRTPPLYNARVHPRF